jgi:hypothetical protein
MDELARFLKTVVLCHHLESLPESERGNTLLLWLPHGSYTERRVVVEYVRLNILAKREVAA